MLSVFNTSWELFHVMICKTRYEIIGTALFSFMWTKHMQLSFGVNLTNKVKGCYYKNYKMLKKKMKIVIEYGLEELIL